MVETHQAVSLNYDSAAPRWGDKMRSLGYYDGYLGFLSAAEFRANGASRIVDVGAGTAAFAEAWVAIYGEPQDLVLLEPSRAMLDRADKTLRARGVEAQLQQGLLGDVGLTDFDEVLAAHVIEHCPDPLIALKQLRAMLRPGGRLRLVVSKPHWCNMIIWLQWRHRTFARQEILSLAKQAGFEIEGTFRFPSGPPSRTSQGIVAVRS